MSTTVLESPSLLDALLNLSRYHRDHERFYASSPRQAAVELQRHARTLQSLADRWSTVVVDERRPFSPFEGCEDLNDPAALQLDGVLFMEGEGRPAELEDMVAHLRSTASAASRISTWLSAAMEGSWDLAASIIEIDDLADVLGERHRIIANDWLAASMNALVSRLLDRAATMLDHIDFSPAALRRDLRGPRVTPARLYSAAELIDRAADLLSESAGLVHDNERRWRVFRAEVEAMTAAGAGSTAGLRQAAQPIQGSQWRRPVDHRREADPLAQQVEDDHDTEDDAARG